ncbi:MAG TPA: DUF4440 domain-containing protein [Chitinophagaceae bacterium]|jgi:ketosteroid isomerase-like protein|nr:DUF4440 domain-containing protein [Chitinophagaceae bacterium]
MRILIFILAFLTVSFAYSQQKTDQKKVVKVKEELEKLWNDMQDAAAKKDRKALENFYADEFVLIHSTGGEDNKERRINNILSIDKYSKAPTPSFDELYVYGDVAVLRVKGLLRGTTIYAKKNGQWQVVQIQSTAMPPERKSVSLDPKILDLYIGKYEQSPGNYTTITKQSDTLMVQGMNRPKIAILPLSETQFYVKGNVGEFTFYKDEKGHVTHYILRVNEREIKGTKVE